VAAGWREGGAGRAAKDSTSPGRAGSQPLWNVDKQQEQHKNKNNQIKLKRTRFCALCCSSSFLCSVLCFPLLCVRELKGNKCIVFGSAATNKILIKM